MPAPDYDWLPVDDVERHIAKVSSAPDGDVEPYRAAAAAVVERARKDLLLTEIVDDVPVVTFTPDAAVKLAGLMLASRYYARRGSALGVASFGEFGATEILRYDPDVASLLGLGRAARPKIG
jgi:hypothetical protein